MGGNIAHHFPAFPLPGNAQTGVHPLCRQLSRGRGGALVKQTQAVPHSAVRQTGDHPRRAVVKINVLLIGDVLQPRRDVLLTDAPEGKPLAPGQNRRRNLVQLRGRKNEQQMLRRLLDDLQQRVEGRNGEHMHLVDDIYPHFHLRRRINGVVPQVADVVHAVVGRGVDLQHVHAGAGIDGLAGFADVAGVTVVGIQAVDRLRQNLGAAGLARAPGAGEQIRMAHFPGHDLGFQGLRHRHLPGNVVKGLGAVFAV